MDFSSRQLRALVAVDARRNISHAAVELGMSQPALSRLVSGIEEDLGVTLFERTVRGVTPTEAGTRVCAHAHDVLRSLADLEDDVRSLDGAVRGRVCVAMPDTVGHAMFLPFLDRFGERHPDAEIRVMGAHPNNVPLAVSAGDADVGIVSDAHKQGTLVAEPFAVEQLHLVGRAGTVGSDDVALADLADVELVLPAIQPGLRQVIDRAFASKGLLPNVVAELDSQDGLLEMMTARDLFSIMSFAGVVRHVGRGTLDAARIVEPTIERTLLTALPDDRPSTRLMRTTVAELRELAADLAPTTRWDVLV